MSHADPALTILSHLESMFKKYLAYRIDQELAPFTLYNDPLAPMPIDSGIGINYYLISSEPTDSTLHHSQERLSFAIDMLYISKEPHAPVHRELLALAYDLKSALTVIQSYAFGLAGRVTNRVHPSLSISNNASENPSVAYAFGQLSFSIESQFIYVDDPKVIHDAKIDWQLLLRPPKGEENEQYS
ncbi:hypothetical protein PVA44_07575 (plasmid) [Entomospira nematocerorum]|uniref:Uncharacterized protein n=1 Tax=Entomospira nematocerorum TaxID=2719987 RepID=A0A968GH55_9SPIO|nr:hypothetical protein [Entomospira nematocera]NIZ47771.1 hypothetical protein [Entomospira nematocera]WDI34725.1 hypothetical protein PVA44_07575 [Entomospira nematocera]